MGERFEIAPGAEGLLARHGLTSLSAVFAFQEGRRLDKPGLEGWRRRLRLTLGTADGRTRTLYLKRFDHPPLRRQWQRWREGHTGWSTAGVEWLNARRLAEAGVPATEAVAFGQDMCGPWERRSFVLLAEVPGESLERWVPRHLPGDQVGEPAAAALDAARRRRLLDAAARLVARLHAAGFVHRDLYLSHLFIDGDSLRLIDLQRVFRPRWRRRRWVVKDLAALHFSAPPERIGRFERLRFLVRYARACGRRFGTARALAGPVEVKARRMARRRPTAAVDCPAS